MGLEALLAAIERGEPVTSVTPRNRAEVTENSLHDKAVTPVTPVTPHDRVESVGRHEAMAEPLRKLGDSERRLLEEWAGDDQDALRYYLAEAERDPELVVNVARDLAAAALSAEPWLRCAVRVIDPDASPVRVVMAYRGVGTAVLEIPGGRWDPWLFLRVLQQQGTAS